MPPIRMMCPVRCRWRCQNLSLEDGKGNRLVVGETERHAVNSVNARNIKRKARIQRKEVLGIEPANPKICQA